MHAVYSMAVEIIHDRSVKPEESNDRSLQTGASVPQTFTYRTGLNRFWTEVELRISFKSIKIELTRALLKICVNI